MLMRGVYAPTPKSSTPDINPSQPKETRKERRAKRSAARRNRTRPKNSPRSLRAFNRYKRRMKNREQQNSSTNYGDIANLIRESFQLNEKKKGPCWKGYKAIGMKMKGGRKVPNCVPVSESIDKIYSLIEKVMPDTIPKLRAARKAKGKEAAKKLAQAKKVADKTKIGNQPPEVSFLNTQAVQAIKAGKKAKQLQKAASVNASVERIGDLITEVAAWQKKAGKNPSGGLNKKGVESYRRENPGSKLKTAVTTKPSKLKKGSKAAKRRKSFCARMGGMKKRRTSAKTANNPDSRINKALRKWNC
jgi:hypothetical protein